jgi:hypothetical protein
VIILDDEETGVRLLAITSWRHESIGAGYDEIVPPLQVPVYRRNGV